MVLLLKKAIEILYPLALAAHFFSESSDDPIVTISSGKLRGSLGHSRMNRLFVKFQGIPYAKHQRFEPPVSPDKWDGIKDAIAMGNTCAQIEFISGTLIGSEDCLVLNTYVPMVHQREVSDTLPVMVFFHGGFFMSGSASLFGAEYFMDEDVILVTVNYRLNSLGFLNTGDSVVRGNMGLKDQVFALKWVRENIANFGGDPSRVTIFGSSSGAASVHLHILSPLSSGLFHRVIAESGSAIRQFSFQPNPKAQAIRLANKVGCPTINSSVMVDCLKSLDFREIVLTHKEFQTVLLDPLAIYAATVETPVPGKEIFLREEPLTILKRGDFSKIPAIFGLNSQEGFLYTARILRNYSLIPEINRNFKELAPMLLNYNPARKDVADKLVNFYFNGREEEIDLKRQFFDFTNMFSDRLYFASSRFSALENSKHAPTFLYFLTHRGEFSFFDLISLSGNLPNAALDAGVSIAANLISENIDGRPKINLGVCHQDETPLLFDLGILSNIRAQSRDFNISVQMVKLWSDFAQNRSTPLKFKDVTLRPVNPNDRSPPYLNINLHPSIIKEPFTRRALFMFEELGLF